MLPGTFCLPESPRHLNFSLGLREIKKEVPEFPVNNSHNIEKKRKEDKIFEFSDKPATMLRKKKKFHVNYRRGRSYNIESCAVSPRSSITIQFCAQQHEQTYFNIQNQYFRFCKVQIFGELILMFFFSLAKMYFSCLMFKMNFELKFWISKEERERDRVGRERGLGTVSQLKFNMKGSSVPLYISNQHSSYLTTSFPPAPFPTAERSLDKRKDYHDVRAKIKFPKICKKDPTKS